MGLPKFKTKISVEDYFEGEQVSKIRHEFINGEVYAMAGASDIHHRISANLFIKLDSHLEDAECEAFMVDMKLKAGESDFYYPDVFVACDKSPESHFYREEPVLIIEVISPSTRQIDRREKLKVYQQIPSIKEYLIIEQEKVHIELHRRQPDGNWLTHFYNKGDFDEKIEFQSVGMEITLDEIYRRVKFEQ
jgi:Uma2 family endonuclease